MTMKRKRAAAVTDLPPDLLRDVMDRLDRGEQAAAACTRRSLRDAQRRRSAREGQRIAAALRHEGMPWRTLARDHLSPKDLHAILDVAEELNRTQRGRARNSAHSEWAFGRLQEIDYFGDKMTLYAIAPRERISRREASVCKRDVVVCYEAYEWALEYETLVEFRGEWACLKDVTCRGAYVSDEMLFDQYLWYSGVSREGKKTTSYNRFCTLRRPMHGVDVPKAFLRLERRNKVANRIVEELHREHLPHYAWLEWYANPRLTKLFPTNVILEAANELVDRDTAETDAAVDGA